MICLLGGLSSTSPGLGYSTEATFPTHGYQWPANPYLNYGYCQVKVSAQLHAYIIVLFVYSYCKGLVLFLLSITPSFIIYSIFCSMEELDLSSLHPLKKPPEIRPGLGKELSRQLMNLSILILCSSLFPLTATRRELNLI
jgi:hypothetical protein